MTGVKQYKRNDVTGKHGTFSLLCPSDSSICVLGALGVLGGVDIKSKSFDFDDALSCGLNKTTMIKTASIIVI